MKPLKHVGIIMDGNGRWAKEQGKPRSYGHKVGTETLRKLSFYIFDKGIEVLSVFCFSTENFARPKEEVDYLMNLFVDKFHKEASFYKKRNIRVVFSGRRENLRTDVLEAMNQITEETKDNTRATLNICLNYGGQYEILDAVKRLVHEKVDLDSLTPEEFMHYFYQDLPPIDFLIRTSGEQRISNFMIYQSSYAELYFPSTYFPDFDEQEFDKALDVYYHRDRRFGGVSKEEK